MKKFKIVLLAICFMIPLLFAGCENFNKNTLTTPKNLSVENGVITFDVVNEAEYYVVNINNYEFTLDASHSNSVELIDNQVNYNANKIFSIGESYTVKVKAIAEEMNDSAYTETLSYKHTNQISKPENIKINGHTLTWDLVKNASFYMVKLITPYHTAIYDHNGNELHGDDSETIAKAQLTSYSFSSNSFNFSSLLTHAGDYNFYINAIAADGSKYTDSGYTNKTTYNHSVKLETPVICKVSENQTNDLLLNAVIDNNSNILTLSCNENVVSRELQECIDLGIVSKTDNIVTINLTNFFSNINFKIVKPYEFKIQVENKINNEENTYYKKSEFSSASVYERTEKISTPVLNISENLQHNCKQVEWTCSDIQNVSKFKVFVATPSGVTTFEVGKTISSMLLPQDFYAVSVQAVGSGNYLSSNLGNFKTNSATSSIGNLNIYKESENELSWNDSADYYFIEFNNTMLITSDNTYIVDLSTITDKTTEFKLTAIKQGYLPYVCTYTFNYSPKLDAPSGLGFRSSNPYLLTFNKVDNAIGYYVYIKSNEANSSYECIKNLYTANAIDLTQYVLTENKNLTYSIKVVAIADNNSIYLSSDDSSAVEVSHQRVLNTPILSNKNAITKQVVNNQTTYTLHFTGVENADSYEILINYNKLTVGKTQTSVDITKYLSAANNYTIMVRAIPSKHATHLFASEYATINYTLTKQLAKVETINVNSNDGIYTLSFSPVNNASAYRVRIVKVADSEYTSHLNSLGLSHIFEVHQATDITAYVSQQGEYHIYITALAAEGGYYGNSDESSVYGSIIKLNSLNKPKSFSVENIDDKTYNLCWVGDDHADYYLVKITDPYGFNYEFNVYDSTKANVSSYLTIQGTYNFSVYSMITPNSTNSINYISSSANEVSLTYIYEQPHDFKRHNITMNNAKYNNHIENVQELKNILWYNYIYKIDALGLPIFISTENYNGANNSYSTEMVRIKILDFASSASSAELGLYNFNADSVWTTQYVPATSTKTNAELLKYICEKLISAYPKMHLPSSVYVVNDENNPNIFTLNYYNTLSPTTLNNTYVSKQEDFNNYFKYLDNYLRRSETYSFAIDEKATTPVETSEQLLYAVENNFKPNFVKENISAEKIYNNAKAVLRTIITNNMTDLEKATKIFDWLSYAYNVNLYADKTTTTIDNNTIYIDADLTEYGKRQEFYLEGIFLNILNSTNGNYDNEFYLGNKNATSYSLSKAFSLLCGIEGIKTISLNGTYLPNAEIKNHSWNKVYLTTPAGTAWYVVDIANSETIDNKSLHTYRYYLITDRVHSTLLKATANPLDYGSSLPANIVYDYYADASFALTVGEIYNNVTTSVYENGKLIAKDFKYSKKFNLHNNYATFGYNADDVIQKYLFNVAIYAKYMLNSSDIDSVSFDFSYTWSENNNSDTLFTNIQAELNAILQHKVLSANYSSIHLQSVKNVKDVVHNLNSTEENPVLDYGRTIFILTFEK